MEARNTLLQLSADAIVNCRDILCHAVEGSVLELEEEKGFESRLGKDLGGKGEAIFYR